jgi:hypothetical protein
MSRMRSRGCPGALQAFSGKCFRKQLETALPPPPEPPPLADFPSACPTSIRFGDLDRQGHVNNAVFATSFESGRVGLIYDAENGPQVPGATSVVVRLEIDFLRELRWPGTVEIGTAVAEIGRSSNCFAPCDLPRGRLRGDRVHPPWC